VTQFMYVCLHVCICTIEKLLFTKRSRRPSESLKFVHSPKLYLTDTHTSCWHCLCCCCCCCCCSSISNAQRVNFVKPIRRLNKRFHNSNSNSNSTLPPRVSYGYALASFGARLAIIRRMVKLYL